MKKAEKKQGTRSSLAQSSSNKLDADPKKIFVGGFGDKITKDDLSGYFEKFGTVTDAVVCYDKLTRKARGFGFVTFDFKEAADKVLENQFHYLKGTKVETTKAKPRSSMDSGGWGHRSSAIYPLEWPLSSSISISIPLRTTWNHELWVHDEPNRH